MVETFSPWLRLAALPCAGEAYNASKLPIVHTTVSNNAAMERTSFNRHQLSCSSPFFKKCFYWNLETLLGIAPFTRENREECVGIRTRVIQVKKRKINSGQKAVLIHFSLFAFWELVRQPIPSRSCLSQQLFCGLFSFGSTGFGRDRNKLYTTVCPACSGNCSFNAFR